MAATTILTLMVHLTTTVVVAAALTLLHQVATVEVEATAAAPMLAVARSKAWVSFSHDCVVSGSSIWGTFRAMWKIVEERLSSTILFNLHVLNLLKLA